MLLMLVDGKIEENVKKLFRDRFCVGNQFVICDFLIWRWGGEIMWDLGED